MSRWIEVEPLIEAHYQHCNEHHGEADVFYMWSLELMRNAPSIDLVRCAECKYLEVLNTRLLYGLCRKFGVDFEPFEDDTRTHGCSWGERKESE